MHSMVLSLAQVIHCRFPLPLKETLQMNRVPAVGSPALPPISPRPITARRWPGVLTAMRRRMS
jgi:hypothetical protein